MKAQLRPFMFSSAVPGTDSHLSFPIISPGFGGRERQRQKETQLPPAVPGSLAREARGKPGADRFAPTPAASRLQDSQAWIVPRAKALQWGWEEEKHGAHHPSDTRA